MSASTGTAPTARDGGEDLRGAVGAVDEAEAEAVDKAEAEAVAEAEAEAEADAVAKAEAEAEDKGGASIGVATATSAAAEGVVMCE
jgi:hypothetical protein